MGEPLGSPPENWPVASGLAEAAALPAALAAAAEAAGLAGALAGAALAGAAAVEAAGLALAAGAATEALAGATVDGAEDTAWPPQAARIRVRAATAHPLARWRENLRVVLC